MKLKTIISLGIVCISLVCGCASVETRCGYQKNYQCPYYGCAKCGPRIMYRCDRICNACASNEGACALCWACINNEVCTFYPLSK